MYCLNKKGQLCERIGERGAPTPVNEDALALKWMRTEGMTLQEAELEIERLKVSLRAPSENVEEHLAAVIDKHNILAGFKVFKSSKFVIVWEHGTEVETIGSFENLTVDVLDNLLSKHIPEEYAKFTKEMAPLLDPKNPLKVSDKTVLEITLNYLKPKQNLPRVEMDTDDIQPALLEGIDGISLRKIAYTPASGRFEEMNPYLQDILSRISNHQHLCAVIYGQFVGKQWPYICYLYGKQGREGKTQFINMVGRLSKSFANLAEDSRFTLFSLYGKAIILVPENDKARLMSSKTIKAITGGSILQIEEKGKTAFSGNVLGTILVDANHPLKISGRNFETDRLRYFTVYPHNKPNNERLSPARYLKELSSTPNEFLNYCRVCYETLLTEGDLLKEPEDHQETMAQLMDEEQDYEYDLIFAKVCKDLKLELIQGAKIPKTEFLHKVKMTFSNKKDYYPTSFLHYLERKGVFVEGKSLVNLGYVSNGHTIVRKVTNE